MRQIIVAAALLLTLAACATPDPVAPGRPPFETLPPSTGPAPSASGAPVSDARLAALTADLRARGVDPTGLRVVESTTTTWPDGAWGCPEPGRHYTQALEPGQKVVVEVGGVRHDYRFGRGDEPRLCEPRR